MREGICCIIYDDNGFLGTLGLEGYYIGCWIFFVFGGEISDIAMVSFGGTRDSLLDEAGFSLVRVGGNFIDNSKVDLDTS